ncbi:MAG: metal-dependent hydrolase [Pirellulales bacterium]|jgi:membrane-bound metal-dependent hydrolase YbcI (DUF457 family)|nr:metal-dependent hydrolase [Pirellulales bacterium]
MNRMPGISPTRTDPTAVPGFRVHITGSSIVGVGYGAAAWYVGGLPPMTCVLGAGLCSIAGMMPDLDSGPGVPLRESVAFAAAVVPLMLVNRLQATGLPTEALILLGAAAYLAIRFGVTKLIKKFAIHRGMFHSLPAALIAAQITYLAFGAENPLCRYFMASAVVIGFLTHLVLDEIWSVRLGMFGPKFKKSFGTALKFVGPNLWPNVTTYGLASVLGIASAGDAAWSEQWAAARERIEQVATEQISALPQTAFLPQGFQQMQPAPAALPQMPFQQQFQPGYQQQYPPQQSYQPQLQPSQQQPWLRR